MQLTELKHLTLEHIRVEIPESMSLLVSLSMVKFISIGRVSDSSFQVGFLIMCLHFPGIYPLVYFLPG